MKKAIKIFFYYSHASYKEYEKIYGSDRKKEAEYRWSFKHEYVYHKDLRDADFVTLNNRYITRTETINFSIRRSRFKSLYRESCGQDWALYDMLHDYYSKIKQVKEKRDRNKKLIGLTKWP